MAGRSEGGSTGSSLAVGRGQMLFGKKFRQELLYMLYRVVTAMFLVTEEEGL
jgi:hypothetical protein